MFEVEFVNIAERTITTFGYDKLMDALTVAKSTNIYDSSVIIRPAMTDEEFEANLLPLLTNGWINCGKKSAEFPAGDHIIRLTRNGLPVYV